MVGICVASGFAQDTVVGLVGLDLFSTSSCWSISLISCFIISTRGICSVLGICVASGFAQDIVVGLVGLVGLDLFSTSN